MIKRIENGAEWVGKAGTVLSAAGLGGCVLGILLLLTIEILGFLFTGEGFREIPRAMWLLDPVGPWVIAVGVIGAWIMALGYGARDLARWYATRAELRRVR